MYGALAFAICIALVFTVGWFWFGWSYVAENRRLMSSLPVPPGAERTRMGSHSYAGDEMPLTPPDGWGTLATFRVSGHTRQTIADFYISRMSPDWEYCLRINSFFEPATGRSWEEMGGVHFVRSIAIVGVDTANVSAKGSGSFDIYVDHDSDRNPCDRSRAFRGAPP